MHTAKSAAVQINMGRYSRVYRNREFEAEARLTDDDWEVWIRYKG